MTESSSKRNAPREPSSLSDCHSRARQNSEPSAASVPSRPGALLITARALKLKCPRCGDGALFEGLLTMHIRCGNCGLTFHREPGYYLGAIYINYGITSLLVTSSYILCRLVLHIPAAQLLLPLAMFCLFFPLLISRHARALWLGMDCRLDASVLEEEFVPVQTADCSDARQLNE